MIPKVTDNFEIILTWDNTSRRTPGADISVLKFDPCSVSEFAVDAEIQFASGMNYQGSTRIAFHTCVYAFELQGFAKNLRALAAGEPIEAMMTGATDFTIKAERMSNLAHPVAELSYTPYRSCDSIGFAISELRLHLGPFADPIGTAKAIEGVLSTLEMDCNISPEHGPLKRQ